MIATVTAVCSSRNIDLARSLGAERVIDYAREDLTRDLDVVLDNVGNRSARASRQTLRSDGTYVATFGRKEARHVEPLGRIVACWRWGRSHRNASSSCRPRRGEQGEVSARHARWCRDQTADIGRLLPGNGELEGVARLAGHWADLRAAVDWACTTGHVDLADALVQPVAAEVSLRRQVEIGDWAERILDLTPPADEARIVYCMLWAGHRRAQADTPEEYDALMRRHGYAEHPVIRFNHLHGNVGTDSLDVSLATIDWLREHGEDHAANLLEVSGVAAS